MNKLFIAFALLCVLTIIGPSFQAQALSFEQLPKNQESKQWTVHVGAAELDKTTVRPKKGVYDLYSFKVKNIGKNVGSITVQAFRDEPNSKTKFALFSEKIAPVRIEKNGQEIVFAVFPLSVKSTELEIIVTWQDDGVIRDMKESFVFIKP
jgi:hypothetical protein